MLKPDVLARAVEAIHAKVWRDAANREVALLLFPKTGGVPPMHQLDLFDHAPLLPMPVQRPRLGETCETTLQRYRDAMGGGEGREQVERPARQVVRAAKP